MGTSYPCGSKCIMENNPTTVSINMQWMGRFVSRFITVSRSSLVLTWEWVRTHSKQEVWTWIATRKTQDLGRESRLSACLWTQRKIPYTPAVREQRKVNVTWTEAAPLPHHPHVCRLPVHVYLSSYYLILSGGKKACLNESGGRRTVRYYCSSQLNASRNSSL